MSFSNKVTYFAIILFTLIILSSSVFAEELEDFERKITGNTISFSSASQVPLPSKPTSNYLVGAFYMPMRSMEKPYDWSWPAIIDYPGRKPLLGYFDEKDKEVKDWEIKWAIENGINFFIFDWFRCNTNDYRNSEWMDTCKTDLGKPITSDKLYLGEALNEGFLKAPYSEKIDFTVMLTSQSPYSYIFNSTTDLRDNLMPFLINNYFKKPNYLKVDGKPVLFIYNCKDLETILGSPQNVNNALTIIRQETTKAGFPGIIILGDSTGFIFKTTADADKVINEYGFDYTFSYITPVVGVDGVLKKDLTEAEAIRSQDQSYKYYNTATPRIPFIPTASPFWDSFAYDFGLSGASTFHISPTGFHQAISNLKTIMNSIPSEQLGHKMILVDAWNEYVEGHYVAPTQEFGFGYLKAIRAQLTSSDNTPDYRTPSQIGLGPYNTIYQNYINTKTINYTDLKNSVLRFDSHLSTKEVLHLNFPLEKKSSISFGTWINPKSFPKTGENSVILGKFASFRIILTANGGGHCVIGTQNNPWYSPGTSVTWNSGKILLNNWNHITCVYDGSKLNLYINGIKVSDSFQASGKYISGNVTNKLSQFNLGNAYSSQDDYTFFNGLMANPFLEGKALSNEEVTLAFTKESSPTGAFSISPAGLLSGWAYDKSNGDAPVNVHFYLDETTPCNWTNNNVLIGTGLANEYRTDVDAKYPGYGNFHGFNYQLKNIPDGIHTITVYAIDNVPGKNVCLGYKSFSFSNSCIGEPPTNATLCNGDNTGLTNNTTNSIVTNCSTTKCEYTCNTGYTKSGNTCVPISSGPYAYLYQNTFTHTTNGYCKFTIYTGLAKTSTGLWNQQNIGGAYVGNKINFACKNLDNIYLFNVSNQPANQLIGTWGNNVYTKTISTGINKIFTNNNWDCWAYVLNNGLTTRAQTIWNGTDNSALYHFTTSNETCNNLDDDCDGLIDEGFDCIKNSTNCTANCTLISSAWVTGDWSPCTGGNCLGGGTQNAIVQCKNSSGNVVADSFCTTTKPSTTRPCTSITCNSNQTCNNGICVNGYRHPLCVENPNTIYSRTQLDSFKNEWTQNQLSLNEIIKRIRIWKYCN